MSRFSLIQIEGQFAERDVWINIPGVEPEDDNAAALLRVHPPADERRGATIIVIAKRGSKSLLNRFQIIRDRQDTPSNDGFGAIWPRALKIL